MTYYKVDTFNISDIFDIVYYPEDNIGDLPLELYSDKTIVNCSDCGDTIDIDTASGIMFISEWYDEPSEGVWCIFSNIPYTEQCIQKMLENIEVISKFADVKTYKV